MIAVGLIAGAADWFAAGLFGAGLAFGRAGGLVAAEGAVAGMAAGEKAVVEKAVGGKAVAGVAVVGKAAGERAAAGEAAAGGDVTGRAVGGKAVGERAAAGNDFVADRAAPAGLVGWARYCPGCVCWNEGLLRPWLMLLVVSQ